MTFKLLITSGCSFSYAHDIKTWPNHLRDHLGIPLLEYSMGSQGNALIARNIEYAVDQALQSHSPDELLVCVMWSGSERADARAPEEHARHTFNRNMVENPTGWIPCSEPKKPWVILNHHFEDKLSRIYYKFLYTHKGGLIHTLEAILRCQWMLKARGIRYVMTQMSHNVIPRGSECEDPELAYLYRSVDFDHWLPVASEYEWCCDHSGIPFPVTGDDHPGLEQHQAFVQRVIVPHLHSKNWL